MRGDHAAVSYRQLSISRKGYEVPVLSNLVEASAHGNVLVEIIRVDVFAIQIVIRIILLEFGILVCTSLLALHMCVASVWKLAFLVSAVAILGIVGTLDHMTLVTLDTFFAITKESKRTADKRAR
jgi:hypothetical protein